MKVETDVHHMPKLAPCPCCQQTLDGAGLVVGPKGSRPNVGDFTVCSYCFEVLRFLPRHQLEWVPVGEVADMDEDVVQGLVCARAFAIGMRVLEGRRKAGMN